MRHHDQQTHDDHPDVITSDPVPVPSPGAPGPEDALDDRGSYDGDPGQGRHAGIPADRDRPDADARTAGDDLVAGDSEARRSGDDEGDEADDALADRGTFADPVLVDEEQADRGADAAGTDGTDRAADASGRADGPDAAERAAADASDPPEGAGDGGAGDPDRPEFHEPAPAPTAFGATTVGGAVAASALATGNRADQPDPREEDTSRPGDGVAEDRIDDVDGDRIDDVDGDRIDDDRPGGPRDAGDRDLGAADAGSRDPAAADTAPVGPTDGNGHFAGRHPGDPATAADPVAVGTPGPTAGSDVLSAGDPDAATGSAGTPVAATRTDDGGAPDETTGTTTDAGTAPDGELLPGAVPAGPITAILAADAVQGFRDRWRDVQLRFVDDPQTAAGEARGLVDDAIDAVSAALAAQKDALGDRQDGEGGDTERLRIMVRQYRDLLDRLLGL